MKRIALIMLGGLALAALAHAAPANVSGLSAATARSVVQADWDAFDKRTGVLRDVYSASGEQIEWGEALSPPFPNTWPPAGTRSVTYYVYADYQTYEQHGPALHFSAPWARVVLQDGQPPAKEIILKTIGPEVSGLGSRPLSREQAQRYIQIEKEGTKAIPALLGWTAVPADSDPSVKAVKEYYCQWERDHEMFTGTYIKNKHRPFFNWLACPKAAPGDNGILP